MAADLLLLSSTFDTVPDGFTSRAGRVSKGNKTNRIKIMQKEQHILRDYAKMMEGNLGEFALNVSGKMDGNAFFPNPKVTPKQMTDKANEYIVAVAISVDGTSADTAHKNAVKAQLIALLDSLADDIESTAQGNVEMLASTGYHLTSPSAVSPAPVGTVTITNINNVASTKLGLDLDVQGSVWSVPVQMMTAPNVWVTLGVFTDLNDVVLTNLVPGTVYTLRACAMAAGNQQSEWCTPVSHMST